NIACADRLTLPGPARLRGAGKRGPGGGGFGWGRVGAEGRGGRRDRGAGRHRPARRHLEEADGPALLIALQDAALYARAAVLARAEADGEEAGSYAATLLALIGTPGGCAALQIGDGVIVAGGQDGGWRWVFWPERGEQANTTRLLTDDDAPGRIRVDALPGSPSDIAIMTDGLLCLALDCAGDGVHE